MGWDDWPPPVYAGGPYGAAPPPHSGRPVHYDDADPYGYPPPHAYPYYAHPPPPCDLKWS